jgi:hypothetical protein
MGGWIVGTSTDDSGRAVCRADRLARLRYQTFAEQGRGEGKGARGGGGCIVPRCELRPLLVPGRFRRFQPGVHARWAGENTALQRWWACGGMLRRCCDTLDQHV